MFNLSSAIPSISSAVAHATTEVERCITSKTENKITAVAWFRLGNCLAREPLQPPHQENSFATVQNQRYTKEGCYQKSIHLNPQDGNSWFNTALYLNGNASFILESQSHSKVKCFTKAFDLRKSSGPTSAFTLDEFHERHLLNLGFALLLGSEQEVSSFEKKHIKKHVCFLKALEKNPTLSRAWYGLGRCRQTFEINGHKYNPQALLQKAIELNPQLAEAWCHLAYTLKKNAKCTINNQEYSKKECYEQAFLLGLPHDFLDAAMWLDFASTLPVSTSQLNWNAPFSQKDCYVESLKKDPQNVKIWYELGLQLDPNETITVNEPCNAQKCFMNALLINQEDPKLWEALAKTISETEKVTIRNRTYSREACLIEAISNGSQSAWYDLAKILPKEKSVKIKGQSYKQGDCCLKAVEVDAKNIDAWKLLATLLEEARENPSFSVILVDLKKNKQHTLSEFYCKILELDNNFVKAWHYLGTYLQGKETVLIGENTYTKLQCCIEAVKLDPCLTGVWYSIGALLKSDEDIKIGDTTYTSLKCYAVELEHHPESVQAWNGLGIELKDKKAIELHGELCDEQLCFRKALLLDPTSSLAWHNLGIALNEGATVEIKGTVYDREGCLLQTLRLDSKDALAWYNLGITLHKKERSDVPYTPEQCLIKAVSLDPKLDSAWINLGLALKDKTIKIDGEDHTSVVCFIKAAILCANNPKVWKHLANTLGEDSIIIGEKSYDAESCLKKAETLIQLGFK